MKVLGKKIQPKEVPVVRPPLKLTLPKPATYPYSTPLSENKQNTEETMIGEKETVPLASGAKPENKSWFIAMDSSPHVKMKSDSVGLKLKLAKQAETPFINIPSKKQSTAFQNTFRWVEGYLE